MCFIAAAEQVCLSAKTIDFDSLSAELPHVFPVKGKNKYTDDQRLILDLFI